MGIFGGLDKDAYDRQYSDAYLFRRLGNYLGQQKRNAAIVTGMGMVVSIAQALMPIIIAAGVDALERGAASRTLALLVQAGLLDEHDFERGHKLYERATNRAHHDHLICVSCSRIVEFHNDAIEELQEQVARDHDFEMVSHTHQIFGFCPRCRREGAKSRPGASARPGRP